MALWAEPLAVPFVAQQKNRCGAASVAMVMHCWSYGSLYVPAFRGIPLVEMKRYLEGQGFRAYTLHGHRADLAAHLGKGRPVIVSLKKKPSGPMHFAVVTGVEKDQDTLRQKADGWTLPAVPTE